MVQNIHQITNKFMYSLISYPNYSRNLDLQCWYFGIDMMETDGQGDNPILGW